MKKRKYIVFLVTIILSAAGINAAAEVNEPLYDDFESYTVAKYGTANGINAKYSTGGGTVYIAENPYAPTMGQSLYAGKESTFFTTQWDMTKNTAIRLYADYMVVSARVTFVDESSVLKIQPEVNASVTQDYAAVGRKAMIFCAADGIMSSGGAKVGLGGIQYGVPTEILCLIKTNGGEPNTATYDIYINGERKNQFAIPLMEGYGNATRVNATGIKYIYFDAVNVYIDDLCVRGGGKDDMEELLTLKKFDYDQSVIDARNAAAAKVFDMNIAVENPYVDIDDSIYRDEIAYLAAVGILNAEAGGSFRPKDYITRSEMTAMAGRTIQNMTIYRFRNAFEDVKPSDWYANTVQSMINCGVFPKSIMSSTSLFGESRAYLGDVMGFCASIMGYYGVENENKNKNSVSLSAYIDNRSLTEAQTEEFKAVIAAGIYNPTDYLKNKELVTREQAAHYIYETIKNI